MYIVHCSPRDGRALPRSKYKKCLDIVTTCNVHTIVYVYIYMQYIYTKQYLSTVHYTVYAMFTIPRMWHNTRVSYLPALNEGVVEMGR